MQNVFVKKTVFPFDCIQSEKAWYVSYQQDRASQVADDDLSVCLGEMQF